MISLLSDNTSRHRNLKIKQRNSWLNKLSDADFKAFKTYRIKQFPTTTTTATEAKRLTKEFNC